MASPLSQPSWSCSCLPRTLVGAVQQRSSLYQSVQNQRRGLVLTAGRQLQHACTSSQTCGGEVRPSWKLPEKATCLLSPLTSANIIRPTRDVRLKAKFQNFHPTAEEATPDSDKELSEQRKPAGDDVSRADDILPNDLSSAICQAGTAAAAFCNAGGTRAIVEILVPDLDVLPEDGAQQRVWESAKEFLQALKGEISCENVRAIFPDAGVAALLKHNWGQEATFAISSLSDRVPIAPEDELVVLVSPEYMLLEKVERIAGMLASEDGLTRPMILWNPRLSTFEVGIGLNVRRMRDIFLRSFTYVYYMRPLGVGAVFRCFPSSWHLFLDDADEPGRYVLYRQQGSKPTGDDLEEMLFAASGKTLDENNEPSFLEQLSNTVTSMSRFMSSLTR